MGFRLTEEGPRSATPRLLLFRRKSNHGEERAPFPATWTHYGSAWWLWGGRRRVRKESWGGRGMRMTRFTRRTLACSLCLRFGARGPRRHLGGPAKLRVEFRGSIDFPAVPSWSVLARRHYPKTKRQFVRLWSRVINSSANRFTFTVKSSLPLTAGIDPSSCRAREGERGAEIKEAERERQSIEHWLPCLWWTGIKMNTIDVRCNRFRHSLMN